MKKVLFVGILGGLLLLVALWATGRSKTDAVAAAGPTVAATTATATLAQAPATTTSPAATAPAPMGDSAACARLADLCSTSDQKVDTDECTKQLRDARKMSGPANVDRSEVCLADAKTCAAASGCISGGIGLGATGEFLKGLGSALSR